MTAPAPRLGFRADINGLRAIAVLAVLAYHFGIVPFGSGFTGVDVFFVISGYLMTGIVVGRLEKGSFSVPGFYLDRARRIIPALLVLVAAVLAMGAVILLPDEYLILAKHAASSAIFASNMLFWNEGGYFNPGADQKWLLHTWSLSVEWQFYLLYPLLVLAANRLFGAARLRIVLALLAILSFGLMAWLSVAESDTGFYLLPPRAWEMLAGGLVFLSPALSGKASRAAQLWGLALILAGTVAFAPSGWPNPWTLLPVLGTALVILAGRTESRITGNPVMAWIGLNSYSIYLWHWPLVQLLKRYDLASDPRWIATGLALSFLLGHLSWRFIEPLSRKRDRTPHIHTAPVRFAWREHLVFMGATGMVLLAGAGIWKARGLPQRFSAEVQMAARDALPAGLPEGLPCYSHVAEVPAPCVIGADKAPVLATLLGDSHAETDLLSLSLARPAGLKGGIAFNAYAACPPVLDAQPVTIGSQCGAFLRRYLEPQTAKRSVPLVLTGRWIDYVERTQFRFADGKDFATHLYASTCKLAAAGPTYVVLPTPEFPFWVSRELQRRLIADAAAPEITLPRAEHEARTKVVSDLFHRAARECGVKLIDLQPILCPGAQCEGSRNHRALFRDEHHFSDTGARLIAPGFAPVFQQSSTANPAPQAAR